MCLVLGLEKVCPRKGCPWPWIFLCPWPRALCPRLHLCSKSLLSRVLEVKHLGVYINYALDWSSHTKYISQQIAEHSGMFYRLPNYIPKKKNALFFTLQLYIPEVESSRMSLALKPQVLENCTDLGSRTALFF